MSCVNTSSKEFKSLLSKVNVSSGTLELLIHKLQNDNEDAPYPTPSEVIAKLSPKAFTSNADMIHAWVNNYSKPRYFRTKDEAEFFFMEDAIRIFGKDSVSLTQTKDGGYIAEVGRPDILPFSLNNGIWSELKNTLKEGPKDALLKAFIEVFEINGRLPIVDISSLPNTEYISANGIKTNGIPLALGGRDSIIFDTNALLSLMSKTPPSMREKVFKQYFLHELTHSVTLAAIDKVEAGKGTKEEKAFYDEINRIYNIAKKAMGAEADSYYGMNNIKEFLAEITSNLSFQKKLSSIKDTKKKNLWNTIIDTFTSFFNKYFNMNIKNSVLESGLRSLSEYVQYAKNNSTSIEATPTELASKVNSVTPGTFLTFNSLSDLQRFLQNEGFTVGVSNSNRTEAEAHIIGKHKYNGAYWLKQWTDESLTSNTNIAKNLLNKVLSNLGIADKGVVTIKDTDNGTIVEFHKEAFEKAKEDILENIQDRDYYENSLLSKSEQYDLEVLDSVDSELSSLIKEGKLSIYEAKDLFEQKNGISIYYQSNPDMAFSQAPSDVQYQSNTQNDTNNYSLEEQGIIDKAKKDGTFMKAPNGKHTNLTERQWAQVRTKAFKDWFGDWEKVAPSTEASIRLINYLNDISNRKNRFSKLAKILLDNGAIPYNLKYFKIDNTRDDVEGYSGMWHSLVNLIEVLGNNVSQETIDKAILHELIHYNTEQLLQNYKDNKKIPIAQKEAIRRLYNIIEYSKNYLSKELQTNRDKYIEIAKRQSNTVNSRLFYAFDSPKSVEIDEFISEIFTNPGLQEVLNNIPYKKSKQSLWGKIKEAISSIFGFDINNGSVLDEALKESSKLIQNNSNISKVVDENGEPLVVYRMNTEPLVKGKFSKGFTYFTTDLEYAEPYARGSKEATLYSVFLNIKNPLDYRLENYEDYARYAHLVKDGTRVKSEDYEIENKLVAKLQKEGKLEDYDGIVGNDTKNWWAEGLGLKAISDGIEYVTFNPNQIKSATDNIGTFSRTDDRIDYFETNNSEKVAESQEALDILKKEGITLDNSLIDKYLLEVKASNPYHQIFKQIVGILNNNNIPINIVVNSNLSNIAARKQDGFKTATIEINPALLLDYLMTDNKDNIKENLMKVLTHELVHAVTAEILNYHPSWAKIKNFNEAQTEFSNNVWNLYLQCKEQLKGTEWYGLTNAKEFIAVALTDRDFQIELSKIKLDKNENAFKRFINYLTDLFNKVFKAQGIDIKNSALEKIISISQEYFNSANKNLRGGIYDYTGTRDYYDNNESFTWDVTSDNSYEVSTLASKNKMSKQEGDARFSAFNAKFKKGTIIDGVDVGGMSIEDVYQKVIKKSGKGEAPAKDSRLNLLNSDNFSTTFKNFPEGVTNVFYGADDEVPRVIFKAPSGEIGQIAYEKNKWRISRKQKNSKGEDVFYGETLSPEVITKIVNKFIPNKFKEYIESGQIDKDYSKDFQDNKNRVQQFFRENYNIHLINEYFFEKGKHETFEDFSYYEAYLPLWQEWARQNPELIDELRTKAKGKTLTDQFANTRVSQARALADILNSQRVKEPTEKTIGDVQEEAPQTDKTEKEQDLYTTKQQDKMQQIDNLLGDNLLSATEVRHIAEQAVYWISDHITELQENPELAKTIYGDRFKNEDDTDKDFASMTRADVVRTIGVDNIIEMCKQKFSPEHNDFDNDDTLDKAFAITDNWQAIMLLAQDSFLNVEDFSIVSTPDGKANEVNEDLVGDADNFNESNDQLDVEEIEGSLQEHWQIESRCQDVLGTMSQMVKRALLKCYILDKDGNNIQSEFGINERINVREATNSILRWTQGSLSLADMVAKLQEKQEDNPWIKQLINRLSDTSGKETDFQGQFYGTFSKHFQPYSVVIEEDGKYKSIQVNENPALSEAMTQVTTQYKIGEHPLFTTDGINKESFKELRAAYDSLEKFRHMGYDLSKEVNKDEAANTLGYISNLFGYYVTPDMVKSNLTKENYKKMYSALGYIVKSFENNLDNASYEPFKFKAKDSINGNMREFLKPITEQLEDIAVSSFYDSGKMYQSYVTPSYMSKLMQKFSQEGEVFDKFLTEEFGNQPWFHEGTDIERGWRNSWLRALATDSKAREIFKHKVQLNFNKHNYMKNMSDMEYTLSLFTEYFSEGANDKQSRVPAWFRVPMLSNKPSSEFIRFYSERGTNYKETITDGMMDIFNQELSRIQTVLMRNLDSKDPRFIKNFDKNGKKFCFLDFMNDYLTGDKKNSELGKLINDKVNGKEVDEAKLYELANKAIFDAMDARAKAIVERWIDSGLMEGAKKITGIGVTEEEIKSNLENFVWNDTFAAMNIMELTVTDIAYYKNAEDLQKRLAQIHAPGIRGNTEATDYEGRKVSDGKERTFYLTDWDNFVSNIIDNVSIVFDRKIAEAPEAEKAGYRALKESLVGENGAFRNINVADAQGYSSPTSYRKKAFIFGKWSKKAEDIYQKLRKGDYNYNDLSIAFQPLKPFVYSQIEKSSGVSNAPLDKFKVPVQNKNSEYLLIMADAILQNENTGRPNLLRAIYEVMEESHYDEDGNYKTDGIDTVQFESTVKSGLMGRINLNKYVNDANGEAKAKAVMKACLYETTPKTVQEVNPETGELEDIVINTKTGKYSQTYVHELPFEDYCLQQEVPEHFKNHEQVHGSQLRYIVVSELATKDSFGNDATYEVEGRKVSADEFKAEYEQTIADNIEDSISELESALALHSTNARDRNIALSKILQREILSSPRYGVDLLQACSVDENGRFRIPLGDPIQSKRVEQLINSIIKNRVNKQEIAGGPVVQVTNFGTSRELNIRFKDKNGGLLKTRAEYEKNPIKKELSQTDKFNAKYKGLKTSNSTMSYEDYIKENQGGIAYFEVFAPIYANNLFSQFADKNGNISIEALEALDPDLLKMIGYRIPTEAKYSMAPLKIVGFLPREAGDGIMLPNDITLLTGSDFDKFYVEIKMC